MPTADACPRCGARVPPSRVAGEFAGACPQCLLREAARAFEEVPTPAPGSRIRDFEILELLGRGGMGSVYKARQLSLGRDVALKILLPRHAASPEFHARFEREARLLAGLSHPNLVHVYDFGREGPHTFLAMEYVEGRTLGFPCPSLLRVVRDLALALQKVHDAGLVHRDVKPSNILLTADGSPKLGDFGIVVRAQAEDRLTETGVFVGSPHYASPEHIAGEELDGRSDLYALGVLLFEGLAGHPPFHGASSAVVLSRHLHEPAPLKELDGRTSPSVRGIVERLLAKKPADRYDRAADVAEALDRAMSEGAPTPRRRLLLGSAAALAAAVGSVALWRRSGADPAPAPPPPAPSARAIDLLALVNPERDTVWGEWTPQNGTLFCPGGRRAYRVQIPYEVPEEYDLAAVIERKTGAESFHLGLSSGGRNWSLLLDTTLSGGGASGLHLLDGRSGAENETTRPGRILAIGTRVEVVVKVRRGHLVATADGKPLLDWTGDFGRLSLLNSAFRTPSPKALFLGSEMDSFQVHRLSLTPVSDPGRSWITPAATADPAAPVDLLKLVNLDRDAVWGLWKREGDAVACLGGARAHRLQFPYRVPEEYDLRLEVRRRGDGNSFHVGLSSGGRSCSVLMEAGGPRLAQSGIHLLDGRPAWQNSTLVVRPLLPLNVPVIVDVEVRKGGIRASADGTLFIDWQGSVEQLGSDSNFRVPNPRVPWIGVEVDSFTISKAVLTPVRGTGRPLR